MSGGLREAAQAVVAHAHKFGYTATSHESMNALRAALASEADTREGLDEPDPDRKGMPPDTDTPCMTCGGSGILRTHGIDPIEIDCPHC